MAVHKHFFSHAEGCRSGSTVYRQSWYEGILDSIEQIINSGAYAYHDKEKPTAIPSFALSTRIAYPMFLALETAKFNAKTKIRSNAIRPRLLNWFNQRRFKAEAFYKSKTDDLWNNHNTSWEMLSSVTYLEDDLPSSIARIKSALNMTFSSIRGDGSIPAKTKRGAMALHDTALELYFFLEELFVLQVHWKA